MISFGMGRMLPQTQQLKYVEKVRRYGSPTLLLAWAPLIGDALCLAAGWLRLSPLRAALFMLIGQWRNVLGVVTVSAAGTLVLFYIFRGVVYVSLPLGSGPFHDVTVWIASLLGMR